MVGISFFESEMIRMGKKPIDLSAMYIIVRHAYSDKATKFVRLHGNMNFAVGGAFCDVMHVIKTTESFQWTCTGIELQ